MGLPLLVWLSYPPRIVISAPSSSRVLKLKALSQLVDAHARAKATGLHQLQREFAQWQLRKPAVMQPPKNVTITWWKNWDWQMEEIALPPPLIRYVRQKKEQWS